eukprot:scaffold3267_cov130-Skeletonema_dohrnii-CCMP3373.AAC.2
MLLQSSITVATRIQPLAFCHISQLSRFHRASSLHLNRILFDTSEIDKSDTSVSGRQESGADEAPMATVTLPKDDYRTIHIAKILGLHNGDSLRAGTVINPSDEEDEFAGLLTDDATITWLPEGKIKKAEPTKNGDPPGSLCISIPQPPKTYLSTQSSDEGMDDTPKVSLLLALPRPLQLSRILPMVSQLGVDQLILTNAMKVPKDYFGSHIFRKPEVLRGMLVEGLAQSGDVRLPNVHVTKRLKVFVEDELDELFPLDEVVRVIAHPQRRDIDGREVGPSPLRMTDIEFPKSDKPRRLLVAVGPEGGWTEPYELDMFRDKGFQQITLGTRVLRSDVAVVSLLSLAHEVCSKSE